MEIPNQLQKDSIGFVKLITHSKNPIEKDWPNKPCSYRDIQSWINQGGNYGVLGGHGGLIIIDADDPEITKLVKEKLPDTFTIKSPLKGSHFYYYCSGIEKKIILKKEDVHFGEIISKGSQVVGPGSIHPDTGTEYKVINDVEIQEVNSEQILSELREYIPLDTPSVDTGIEIGDVKITDILSRNNIQCQQSGTRLWCGHPVHGSTNNNNFNVDSVKNVWHCFRCSSGGGALSLIAVLERIIDCSEAVPGGLRGDKYKGTLKIAREKYGFNKGSTDIRNLLNDRTPSFNTKRVMEEIMNQHTLIHSAGDFYEYQDGYYRKVEESEIKKWIMDLLGTSLSKHKTQEIMFFLDPAVHVSEECLNREDYLNVKNGLFDLESGKLVDHSPNVYSTIQLNVTYNTEAKCDLWIKTLKEIFPDEDEKQKIDVLQEFFGLCLTKETRYEKALLCIGEGRNGKSVILWVLQHLLKRENISAIPLEKFENSHYLINLFGKLANISIETNARSEVYDSIFKAVVTGDLIEADQKFKPSVQFNPFCKLVFATNNFPHVDDKSDAFFARLLILRFVRQFSETEQNKNLKYELLSELDGILIWSLEGLRRLKARGYFKIPDDMQKEIDEYRDDNNNVKLFVNDACILSPDATVSIGSLFEGFVAWCEYNGCQHQKQIRFGKELQRQFTGLVKETGTNGKWFWRGIDLRSEYQMKWASRKRRARRVAI